jgi:hypothetical protein
VFRSIDHAARYQSIAELVELPEWMVRSGIPGGGYPEKTDRIIAQRCKELGRPVPDYIQHTGGDAEFLERTLATGRIVSVTYAGRDNRYRGPIDHMVNLVYLDSAAACILDNNYVGAYLWMSRDEFLTRWRDRGGGWAIAFMASPPPAPPHN